MICPMPQHPSRRFTTEPKFNPRINNFFNIKILSCVNLFKRSVFRKNQILSSFLAVCH